MQHSPATAPSCPVPLELLALLLRCDTARLTAAIGDLPETSRAALAVYCFERYHMRRLGFAVALHCSEASLEAAGGTAGRQMLELARHMAEADGKPDGRAKRPQARPARIAA